MIARTQPVGVKLKPDPPEDDATKVKRMSATVRRHLIAISKVADELERMAEEQERKAA